MEPYVASGDKTVIMQQPAAGGTTIINMNAPNPMMPRGIPRDWTTGLCAMCDDMAVCLCETFVPCHVCMVASDMGEGVCMPCCIPAPWLVMRAHARGKHNIQGSLLNDCCVSLWCGPCAACQLAREIKMIKNGQAQP
ncbi:Cornifelin-like A [Holothuria leucospilota]|uniref:Cornifelin-like A n=1 Tax=Holothuria leucospilota TaxID=206669 RepID=A0A9Q1H596_HOLLE|nr:Cornifelin-like A [Holothuria leucospilota]